MVALQNTRMRICCVVTAQYSNASCKQASNVCARCRGGAQLCTCHCDRCAMIWGHQALQEECNCNLEALYGCCTCLSDLTVHLVCESRHPEHCKQCCSCKHLHVAIFYMSSSIAHIAEHACMLESSKRSHAADCISMAVLLRLCTEFERGPRVNSKASNKGLPCLGLISSCVSKTRYRYCSQPGVERTTLVMATPGSVAHTNTLVSAASRRRNSAVERICMMTNSSKTYRLLFCRRTSKRRLARRLCLWKHFGNLKGIIGKG